MTAIYSHFLQYLTNTGYLLISLLYEAHTYGTKFGRRLLDKNLCAEGNSNMS